MSDSPGDRIAQLREAKNMSQAELGRRVGKERQYINAAEHSRFIPKWPTMSKIAKALGTSVQKLYEG